MADTDEQKKTWRDYIKYIIMAVVGLAIAAGVGWMVYTNMTSKKSVSFNLPDSITVTTTKK